MSGGATATYTYDGDGTLAKKVAGGATVVYVGRHYEKHTPTGEVIKHYYLGGQRVAVRKGGTLSYLYSDHLGSASLATNASGGVVSQMRYDPYGEMRWSSGTLPTDRRYTGQRLDSYTQLYPMGARWYDPVLARWTSPDSIIPDLSSSQAWNRYSYVYNNPHRYVDKDGHTPLLATALIGAGIGATVNTVQLRGNRNRHCGYCVRWSCRGRTGRTSGCTYTSFLGWGGADDERRWS